jgi:hypothetical protein
MAFLNRVGKTPEDKLSLIIRVNEGRTTSIHSTSKGVGRGARGHVVGFDLRIMDLRSSSEIGWNDEKEEVTPTSP